MKVNKENKNTKSIQSSTFSKQDLESLKNQNSVEKFEPSNIGINHYLESEENVNIPEINSF